MKTNSSRPSLEFRVLEVALADHSPTQVVSAKIARLATSKGASDSHSFVYHCSDYLCGFVESENEK